MRGARPREAKGSRGLRNVRIRAGPRNPAQQRDSRVEAAGIEPAQDSKPEAAPRVSASSSAKHDVGARSLIQGFDARLPPRGDEILADVVLLETTLISRAAVL